MRAVVFAVMALFSTLALAQAPAFEEGKHYFVIEPAQPTSSGNKIEVVEAFMYTCPHCADLEPFLLAYRKNLPADVQFVPMPVAWNGGAEAFARAYYAAETLGIVEKTHEPMFAAIHKEGVRFTNMEDIANWYAKYGVTAEAFMSAANSFAVNTKINRSKTMVPRYGITGTPMVVVNGKYRVDVTSAGGHQQLVDVLKFLVDKERAAKKP
jgi:thiol:disulfide interchange protein DsbA